MTDKPQPEKKPEKQGAEPTSSSTVPAANPVPPANKAEPKPPAAASPAEIPKKKPGTELPFDDDEEEPPKTGPEKFTSPPATRDIAEILKEISAKDATIPSKNNPLSGLIPSKDDTHAAPVEKPAAPPPAAPAAPAASAAPPPAAPAAQICPTCGHRNRPGTLICDNCGTNLMPGNRAAVGTRDLIREQEKETEKSGENLLDTGEARAVETAGATTFTEEMVLRVEIEGGTTPMLVYPKQEIILGRRDPNTGGMPDVDLTAYAGYRMGVSRRHAAIRLLDKHLNLSDLGSSNGTFLNGTRLTAHRPYQVRDGDEIRLGQMVLRVYFQSNKDKK